MRRIGSRPRAPSLFQPGDGLVGARLQQMYEADPGIPPPYARVAGAQPDGLLGKRNSLLIRAAGQELAHAQFNKGIGIVAIGGERDLEFGNRVSAPPLEAQQSAL